MDTGIHVLIQEIVIHVTNDNINLYNYVHYITMFYCFHVTIVF